MVQQGFGTMDGIHIHESKFSHQVVDSVAEQERERHTQTLKWVTVTEEWILYSLHAIAKMCGSDAQLSRYNRETRHTKVTVQLWELPHSVPWFK